MKRAILFLFASMFVSCSFILSPSASSEMVKKVTEAAQMTDQAYLQMIESEDRSYSIFEDIYISIESEINSIILLDAVRENSSDILKIATLLKEHFIKYKDDHKTRQVLSAAELRAYNNDLKAFWQSLLQAEKSLK